VVLLIAVTETIPDTVPELMERFPESVTLIPWKLKEPLTGGSLEAGTVTDGSVCVSSAVACAHDTVKLGRVPPFIGTLA
jgi:hypothetical protein